MDTNQHRREMRQSPYVHRTRAIPTVLIGLVLSIGLVPALSTPADASTFHLTLAHNIATVPDQFNSPPSPCSFVHNNNDPTCTNYLLEAINHARAIEGVPPMTLPANWYTLTIPEQLFVLADLERVDRGLPPYLGLNRALSANAASAAAHTVDPTIARGFPIAYTPASYAMLGSVWSNGWSPLLADYGWMYNDGWGGSIAATSNAVCVSAKAPACWGHREQLLGSDPGFNPGVGLECTTCEVGTGYAHVSDGSYADLIEKPAGAPPAMYFTWARDVAPFISTPAANTQIHGPVDVFQHIRRSLRTTTRTTTAQLRAFAVSATTPLAKMTGVHVTLVASSAKSSLGQSTALLQRAAATFSAQLARDHFVTAVSSSTQVSTHVPRGAVELSVLISFTNA